MQPIILILIPWACRPSQKGLSKHNDKYQRCFLATFSLSFILFALWTLLYFPRIAYCLVAIISIRWLTFLSFFAGFLNRDVLMYVWDQYVIGLDVAGYHMHFLPAFTATLFILLKDDIMACKNVSWVAQLNFPGVICNECISWHGFPQRLLCCNV